MRITHIAVLFLLAIFAIACGKGEEPAQEATDAVSPKTSQLFDLPRFERYEASIPRIIIWDPEFKPGVDPLFRKEAEYFVSVVRTTFGQAPEPLAEVSQTLFHRVFPSKESKLWKEMVEYDDYDLSKRAGSLGGSMHLRISAEQQGDQATITCRLINCKSFALAFEWTFTGDWQGHFARFAEETPAILKIAGVAAITEEQEEFLRRPRVTSMKHFLDLAHNMDDEEGNVRRVEEWFAAEPENHFLRGLALSNAFRGENPDAEPAALAALRESSTLDFHLARRIMVSFVWQQRNEEALHLANVIRETYPALIEVASDRAEILKELGRTEEAIEAWDILAKRSPEFWMPHLLAGSTYYTKAMQVQAGRTVNQFSRNETTVWRKFLEESENRLRLAYQLNPHDSYSALRYGSIQKMTGANPKLALAIMERSMELNPSLHEAIPNIFWVCAPGYSHLSEEGRMYFQKFKDIDIHPQIRLDAMLPLIQIFTNTLGATDPDAHNFASREPELSVEFLHFILAALADPRVYETTPAHMHQLMTAMRVAGIISLHWWLLPEDDGAMEQIHRNLIVATAYLPTRTLVAWMTEMAGDLETAEELYLSPVGDDPVAHHRLIVLQAKKGDVAGALASLEKHSNDPDYDRLKMEVLAQGNKMQRRNAVEVGLSKDLETVAIHWFATWLDVCHAAGDHQTGKDAIAKRYAGKPLDPSVSQRWKRFCKELGVADEWPV